MLRKCKICPEWHDLAEPWPEECFGHYRPAASGIQIIKDIEPYRAVFVDERTGKRPVIKSRGEHREALKANRLHEYTPITRKAEYAEVNPREIKHEVDRAITQIRSRG